MVDDGKQPSDHLDCKCDRQWAQKKTKWSCPALSCKFLSHFGLGTCLLAGAHLSRRMYTFLEADDQAHSLNFKSKDMEQETLLERHLRFSSRVWQVVITLWDVF